MQYTASVLIMTFTTIHCMHCQNDTDVLWELVCPKYVYLYITKGIHPKIMNMTGAPFTNLD